MIHREELDERMRSVAGEALKEMEMLDTARRQGLGVVSQSFLPGSKSRMENVAR